MKPLLNQLRARLGRPYSRPRHFREWGDTPLLTVAVSNLCIDVDRVPIQLRMYHGTPERPLVVFYHGGGWVLGDLDTHDRFCRGISNESGCSVISVNYRLAPEFTFPAAHDDCLGATKWIARNIDNLAPNNGNYVVSGDSAGGNIAIATAINCQTDPRLAGCLAVYPATQHYISDLPSYTEHAKTGHLRARTMRWFCDTYLGGLMPADPKLERMFPGRRTSLSGFPRAMIITAERDPLRDDGARFAVRLHRAGVTVAYKHLEKAAHGLVCSEGDSRDFNLAVMHASQWLKAIPTQK
mgnify:CR=1 FL=1